MLDIHKIPFFSGSDITIDMEIYSNDPHPVCFKVSHDYVDYKIRIHSTNNPNAILRELKVLKLLSMHKKGWHPRIIDYCIDGSPEEWYLIETFFSGKSLEKYDVADLTGSFDFLASKLFQYLVEMHSTHDKYYHSFIGDAYNSYSDMLAVRAKKHIDSIMMYDAELGKRLSSCMIELLHSNNEFLTNIEPTLLHFDLKPQNIIFDLDEHKVNIIDFEHSRFGNPFHDLVRARLKFEQGHRFFKDLWTEVESRYIQKFGTPCPVSGLVYQIYCYIVELPYLYKTGSYAEIITMRKAALAAIKLC